MAERITMKTILPIDASKARELYNAGNDAVKSILEESFGKDFCERGFCNRDIKERVKTYEDACKVLHIATNVVDNQINGLVGSGCRSLGAHVIAYMKLCTIIEALNEGWEPNWDDINERKYHPSFLMSPSSFAFNVSYCEYSAATAGGGSRLCLKSKELSNYCGKQFIDLWKEFIL